jgi:hypothetical protein
MSKQSFMATNRQHTNTPAPLACPFCGQSKVVRYYSFAPSPDLIGLPGTVTAKAAISTPCAAHPTVRPDGKQPAEKPCRVPAQPPKPRQRWSSPKVFIPRKEITAFNRGGNTR